MPAFKLRMRTSAALLAGAAGLTALGAGLMPAAASAATASPQTIAAQIVPANQLASFSQIISHESSWNVTATNPSSGAYGLAQALPGSKMASAGADWRTNPTTQIKWALDYMNSRYGSPNAAWSFWQTHHWY
ncbi:transglycosylase SLT domain-containing protein [Kitasatospora sp. RG8]|nr:transglycosylase SLT domain-containing protein [Kitasatospora sp. RG8]